MVTFYYCLTVAWFLATTVLTVGASARSCYVVNKMRLANSDQFLLWKSFSTTPILAVPKSQPSRQWMLFVYSGGLVELAHSTKEGKCQYLVKNRQSDSLELTRPKRCHSSPRQRSSFVYRASTGGDWIGLEFKIPGRARSKMFVGRSGGKSSLVLTPESSRNSIHWWTWKLKKINCLQHINQKRASIL